MALPDQRDPQTLGEQLLAVRQMYPDLPLSKVAHMIDRGISGPEMLSPAYMNGKSHERLHVVVMRPE